MVNKPLIRPYFLGGVALGGVARIPLKIGRKPKMERRTVFQPSIFRGEGYVSFRYTG